MDIVKKNILSIVCGVIALISVIAIFYPLRGMYAAMTADVAKSKAVGDQLAAVAKTDRTWPTLSDKDTDRVPLKHFPTAATVEVGTKMTESWTHDANQFLEDALRVETQNLQLLVPGSLPGNSGQTAIAYAFQDEYAKTFNLMRGNTGAQGGVVPMPSAPRHVLNTPLVGTLPPSEQDIKLQADTKEASIRQEMPRYVDNQLVNGPDVEAAVAKSRAEVGDQLRTQNALHSMVYLDPAQTFQPNPRIVGNVAPAPDDIFDAQVGLWLQQEICTAVYETNAGSKQGVLDAPIKRLVSIRFPQLYNMSSANGAPGAPPAAGAPAATDAPAVPPMPTAKIAVDYKVNPLGQVSNDFYDVLPFQLTIVCEADEVPRVLTDLSRRRYIMYRAVDVQSLDSAIPLIQGFMYGSKPVVQLTLQGQYLMLRKFIGPYMPPDVVRGLIAAAAAPQG